MVEKIYLEKKLSQKTGNAYLALVVDVGWARPQLFVDFEFVNTVFGLSKFELSQLAVGDKIELKIKK